MSSDAFAICRGVRLANPQTHDDCSSYFEPNVLYNNATSMYVLTWSHLMANQIPPNVHEIPLATSRVPQGPYRRGRNESALRRPLAIKNPCRKQ